MEAYLLPNGNMMVPKCGDDGDIHIDYYEEVRPGSADYKEWVEWFRRIGEEVPESE